jgi:hypothetical protein
VRPSRLISWLIFPIIVTVVATGCVFGRPSGECEITSEVTEADCNHAIQAALPKLPNDVAATKLTVRAGCARDKHCPSTLNALLVTVEVTFRGSDRLGVIEVRRDTWEATELRYLPAPSTP